MKYFLNAYSVKIYFTENNQSVPKYTYTHSPGYLFFLKESWIKEIKQLPMEHYPEYIKKEIYPLFSGAEQSLWRKNTFSNKDLQDAIIAFFDGEN